MIYNEATFSSLIFSREQLKLKDYLLLTYHLSLFRCLKIIYTVYNSVFSVIQSIISFALYTYLSNNFLSEWNTLGSEWYFVNISKEVYCQNTIFAFLKGKDFLCERKIFLTVRIAIYYFLESLFLATFTNGLSTHLSS